MALIKCPECGQDVSDKAKICPHCGYELPASSPNAYVPPTETEAEPFAELAPATSQAAQQAKSASQPPVTPLSAEAGSSVDNKSKKLTIAAYIDEITTAWKKERRGEYIFGVFLSILGFAGIAIMLGFAIEWIVKVGVRWIFDFHLADNNLIYRARDLEKTRNAVAIIISFSLVFLFSEIFDNFWKPYRIKAWAKRKGIDLKAEVRALTQTMKNDDKEDTIQTVVYLPEGSVAALILAIAYDRSPLGYMLAEIIRKCLDFVSVIMFVCALQIFMRNNMNASILHTVLPVPVGAIVLLVLGVAFDLLDPVLRKVVKKVVRGYYPTSAASSTSNTPQS